MREQAFEYSVNLLRAIVWQYDSAANLRGLVQAQQDWMDDNQEAFWTDWYTDVFDLRTANTFGLTVWSIILGVPLVGPSSSGKEGPAWAFGSARQNFGRGNFGGSGAPIALQEEEARLVLRLRYYQLVSRGTVPATNAFLAELFADQGPVYVVDNYDMTMDFVFGFTPGANLRYVLDRLDILPRPSGVLANYTVEPVCTPPEYGDYPTEYLANLVDSSDTFAASVADCDPYIIRIDNFQATGGDLSIEFSSTTGSAIYKLFIDGLQVGYGDVVDGPIWGNFSSSYSNIVEVELQIFCALESDTASVDVDFAYSATEVCQVPDYGDITPDDSVSWSYPMTANNFYSGTLTGCSPYAIKVDITYPLSTTMGRLYIQQTGSDSGILYSVYADGVLYESGTFTDSGNLEVWNTGDETADEVILVLQNTDATQSLAYNVRELVSTA